MKIPYKNVLLRTFAVFMALATSVTTEVAHGNKRTGADDTEQYQAIGFGSSATGGLGGEVCTVTNLNNDGSGSLRACINKQGKSGRPSIVNFLVSGTIWTENYIYLNSNITIDGRGSDITVSGVNGFACFGKENIIVRNITISDVGAGMRFRDACRKIWIDHVYITRSADEGIALDQGTTDVTISWSRFDNTDKSVLVGSSYADTATANSVVTLHNNVFSAVHRNPNVRHATVHMFNNLIYDFQYEGTIASQNAKILAENNIYIPAKNAPRKMFAIRAAKHNRGDTTNGYVWSSGNLFLEGAKVSGNGLMQRDSKPDTLLRNLTDKMIHPMPWITIPEQIKVPYNYILQDANDDLVDELMLRAGATL